MNRREMFKALGALPLAIVGVASVKSIGGTSIDPSFVRAGSIAVHEDIGSLRTFEFTMMKEPWPRPGQKVEIHYGDMHLAGEVLEILIQDVWKGVHFFCRVRGAVTSFQLPGA